MNYMMIYAYVGLNQVMMVYDVRVMLSMGMYNYNYLYSVYCYHYDEYLLHRWNFLLIDIYLDQYPNLNVDYYILYYYDYYNIVMYLYNISLILCCLMYDYCYHSLYY